MATRQKRVGNLIVPQHIAYLVEDCAAHRGSNKTALFWETAVDWLILEWSRGLADLGPVHKLPRQFRFSARKHCPAAGYDAATVTEAMRWRRFWLGRLVGDQPDARLRVMSGLFPFLVHLVAAHFEPQEFAPCEANELPDPEATGKPMPGIPQEMLFLDSMVRNESRLRKTVCGAKPATTPEQRESVRKRNLQRDGVVRWLLMNFEDASTAGSKAGELPNRAVAAFAVHHLGYDQQLVRDVAAIRAAFRARRGPDAPFQLLPFILRTSKELRLVSGLSRGRVELPPMGPPPPADPEGDASGASDEGAA